MKRWIPVVVLAVCALLMVGPSTRPMPELLTELKRLQAENAKLRVELDRLKAPRVPLEKTTPPEKKFAYVSDKLNKPCGRTMLEWNCAANRIQQQPTPLKLCRDFNLVHLVASPTPARLVVKANCEPRPKIVIDTSPEGWQFVVTNATHFVLPEIRRRFGDGNRRGGAFGEFRDVRLEFYVNGTLAAIRTRTGIDYKARP